MPATCAFIGDVDLGAGLFGQRADDGAALADDVADFLRVDLEGDDARCVIGHFGTRCGNCFVHDFEHVQARIFGLLQRRFHDLAVDAFDLDVHLQRGYAFGGASDFKVHVAEVIFVTEDVGEHGKTIFFLDQAHGDTGHRDRKSVV